MSDYQNQNVYFLTDDLTSHNDLQDALETIADQAESVEQALGWNIEIHKKLEFTHKSFVNGSSIIELIAENGYGEGGEFAEDYLYDLLYDKEKIVQFEKIITDWLNKNAEQPRFWQSAGLLETINPTKEMFEQYDITLGFGGENT